MGSGVRWGREASGDQKTVGWGAWAVLGQQGATEVFVSSSSLRQVCVPRGPLAAVWGAGEGYRQPWGSTDTSKGPLLLGER